MTVDAQSWLATRWPTTVVRDRYGGVYSGGTWLAFPLRPESVPSAAADSDVPCRRFWDEHRKAASLPIGVGETPDEAVAALERAVRDGGRRP